MANFDLTNSTEYYTQEQSRKWTIQLYVTLCEYAFYPDIPK